MTRICCECHRVIEFDREDTRVSHGLCWRCATKASANLPGPYMVWRWDRPENVEDYGVDPRAAVADAMGIPYRYL